MPRPLEDYLLEWDQRRDLGEAISPTDLCPDWPEGQAELARVIPLLEAFDRLLAAEEPPPAPEAPVIPTTVAGYQVLGRLGQGGMGVVYKVWDPNLRREAALKMLLPEGRQAMPDEAANLARRFQQEAQVLAQLEHEYIVKVFEAKEEDGRAYFVMECMPDGSLAPRLSAMTAAGPKVIVPFMAKVARAVHHAHCQGVLHRDLKPANILVEWQPGNGKPPIPRVSDFGLAKILSMEVDPDAETAVRPPDSSSADFEAFEASRLTAPGFQPGTAAYMAPEQLDPTLAPVGPATDVWALGVVLYELLTGQKPFARGSREQVRRIVCHESPGRLRMPNGRLDKRLEEIVLRCLHKEPGKRFESAGQLADALNRWCRPRRLVKWGTIILTPVFLLLGLGILIVRERDPERRYERRTAPLLAQLQRGETVELIEPGGETPPYRIRCVEGVTGVWMSEQGLCVSSPRMAIVELLPPVSLQRYRIEAEIRHDRTYQPGPTWVGITFLGGQGPSPEGTHHVAANVSFDDHLSWERAERNGEVKLKSMAHLELLWYVVRPSDKDPHWQKQQYSSNYLTWFPYVKQAQKPWRNLAVDVQPDKVIASYEDDPRGVMGPFDPANILLFKKTIGDTNIPKGFAFPTDLERLQQKRVGILVIASKCTVRQLRIVPQ